MSGLNKTKRRIFHWIKELDINGQKGYLAGYEGICSWISMGYVG
jgi:hypothetical protein